MLLIYRELNIKLTYQCTNVYMDNLSVDNNISEEYKKRRMAHFAGYF